MIEAELQVLAEVLRGEQRGAATVRGASIDTRTLAAGNLFFALSGERVDGHTCLDAAQQAGASAAVVERFVDDCKLAQLKVGNVRQALGQLAAWWRKQLPGKVVAITGSNGKTTVKEMLAAILRQAGETLATSGNYNNDLGMPLSLLRAGKQHRFVVLEMGANHFGEIAYMTHIARPDVALVNNAGPAHLEGFGDIAGVARAKGEIYSGLPATGVAVINADDPRADVWRSLCADKQTCSFALEASADVTGVWSAIDHELLLQAEAGQIALRLNVLGRHNALNALAASTSALLLGASLQQVKAGLESVQAVDGRLKLITLNADVQLIDDSYNANPASLLAGAQVAVEMAMGEAWLALGDLAELGENAAAIHAELGEQLKAKGIVRLFTLGADSAQSTATFKQGAAHFDDCAALVAALRHSLTQAARQATPVTLLVKGSRGSRMERVVQALIQHGGE